MESLLAIVSVLAFIAEYRHTIAAFGEAIRPDDWVDRRADDNEKKSFLSDPSPTEGKGSLVWLARIGEA